MSRVRASRGGRWMEGKRKMCALVPDGGPCGRLVARGGAVGASGARCKSVASRSDALACKSAQWRAVLAVLL